MLFGWDCCSRPCCLVTRSARRSFQGHDFLSTFLFSEDTFSGQTFSRHSCFRARDLLSTFLFQRQQSLLTFLFRRTRFSVDILVSHVTMFRGHDFLSTLLFQDNGSCSSAVQAQRVMHAVEKCLFSKSFFREHNNTCFHDMRCFKRPPLQSERLKLRNVFFEVHRCDRVSP